MSNRYILDLATTPLAGAEAWLPPVRPARNLKDPVKIAADIAEKETEQREKMGLDLDLCRITALGTCDVTGWTTGPVTVELAETEADEAALLASWLPRLRDAETITFNGLAFDLPLLERRLMYLGLAPLGWNLDKYRTRHVDLLAKLSNFGSRPYRSLEFYCKRLGWADLKKPLSGAEEATALRDGKALELAESVRHDVTATLRLAAWMRVVSLTDTEVPV